MTKSKKDLQLGMSAGTARNRLTRDILWDLIVKTNQDSCYKCKEKMSRETFSIEHIIPWLDSEDPLGLFFDLENISFSHLFCNVSDARKPHKKYFSEEERAEANKILSRESKVRNYCPIKRREKYIQKGY